MTGHRRGGELAGGTEPVRQVLADRRGATLIEFAIIASPFFFLIFATVELGLAFVASTSLSNATFQMARQIRVGQIVAPGMSVTTGTSTYLTLSGFKAAICNMITIVPTATCLSQIQVDIRPQSSYSGISIGTPVSGQSFDSTSLCYYSGLSGSIVTMNIYFLWSVQTPLLTVALNQITSYKTSGGTAAGNYYLLSASEVFKNEPNPNNSNTGNGC